MRLLKLGMRSCSGVLILALFGTGASWVAAAEGNEGERGLAFDSQTRERAKKGRSLVVTIGIDQYQHWPKLRNAVWDAKTVGRLLTEQFGFESLGEPLFDENATRPNIEALIKDILREKLTPEDELLFFFAGHGTMSASQVGGERQLQEGYLVPVEARSGKEERLSQYLLIHSLLQDLGKLPARHVLVILDSCHSGFGLSQEFRGGFAQRFTNDLSGRISRRVLTSARENQRALDGGPGTSHSLFAGVLLEGLRLGAADLDQNGWITSSELGVFLENRVGQQSGSKQTPGFAAFQFDGGARCSLPRLVRLLLPWPLRKGPILQSSIGRLGFCHACTTMTLMPLFLRLPSGE